MNETSPSAHRLVRFGVYELDLHSGDLRKSGARLTLQQQPLQLLSVLLEHPGELVTRDELRTRLWPDDTFVDFEHGLNAAVKRLRDTLGDSADSPRFVETVPRRGYRFIAPVRLPDAPVARTTPAAGRWRVGWVRMIVAVGAAAVIAIGSWALRKSLVRETAPHGPAGPVIRLTHGSDLNTEPTVSPDGEWVAYASDRSGEGNLDIWMQRLSGGEAVRLTRDVADEREPTFSDDGSRIAFRSEREGGGIYVMPAHTGGEAKLLVRGAHGPRFSPDGRWLAYSTGPGRFSIDKALGFTAQTYVISTTGEESTRVLPDFASVAWPVWSPDGRRLLVSARRTITEDPAWWVVAPDNRAPVKSRGVTVVVPGAAGFPVRPWTWIEGNRIVYSAALGGDSWDLWEVALVPDTWVVSSEPRRLTTGADLQTHASIVGGTQSRLLESDPDHQCMEPSAGRQGWSRRGSCAKGDVDLHAPVVALRVRRWPASGISWRERRSLDTGARYRSRGSSRLIPTARHWVHNGGRLPSRLCDLRREAGDLCGAVIGWRAGKTVRGL